MFSIGRVSGILTVLLIVPTVAYAIIALIMNDPNWFIDMGLAGKIWWGVVLLIWFCICGANFSD